MLLCDVLENYGDQKKIRGWQKADGDEGAELRGVFGQEN